MTDLMLQWASLCDAFLVEAKWFASRHLPKPEEYLKNGIVSSGIHVVLVHMFFLLGEGENLDYENSGIISSVATILRLWDDLGSAKVIKLHKYMHVFIIVIHKHNLKGKKFIYSMHHVVFVSLTCHWTKL